MLLPISKVLPTHMLEQAINPILYEGDPGSAAQRPMRQRIPFATCVRPDLACWDDSKKSANLALADPMGWPVMQESAVLAGWWADDWANPRAPNPAQLPGRPASEG